MKNRNQIAILLLVTAPLLAAETAAGTVSDLLAQYRGQGASAFDANRGREFWNRANMIDEKERNCRSCHGNNMKEAGRHQRTKKIIEPMAPSVNSQRYTERKKVEKWFKRNCKWTLGRECTLQEKGDVLSFISQQ